MTEYGASRIRIFSSAGADLLAITTPYTPGGVAIGSDGLIYVVPYNAGAISRYSALGMDLGLFFVSLDDLGTFAAVDDPGSSYGLAFDSEGNLYAANYGGTNIRKFSPTGADLGIFTSAGLSLPRDLVVVPGPVTKDQCENGGWKTFQFPRPFKNQGDCIQFINTGK